MRMCSSTSAGPSCATRTGRSPTCAPAWSTGPGRHSGGGAWPTGTSPASRRSPRRRAPSWGRWVRWPTPRGSRHCGRCYGWRRHLPSGTLLLSFGGGTAVVAAATVAVVLAASPQTGPPPQPPGGSGGGVPTVATPAPSANLPVYYLGTTSFGLRLFREYHVLPVTGSDKVAQTRAALGAMLATSSPGDPDYTTPWRDATVTSVRVDGDTTTVDLHGVPAAPPSGAGAARIAVQQLVWTVTAVSGKPAVRVLLDGRTVPALWGVEGLDEPLTRAPRTDVQAPIWLIDPRQAAPIGHTVAPNLTGTGPDGVAGLRRLRGNTVGGD